MITNPCSQVFQFSKKRHIYNCNLLHLLCWMTGGFYKESQNRKQQMKTCFQLSHCIFKFFVEDGNAYPMNKFDCCLRINPLICHLCSDSRFDFDQLSEEVQSRLDRGLDHEAMKYLYLPKGEWRMFATEKKHNSSCLSLAPFGRCWFVSIYV